MESEAAEMISYDKMPLVGNVYTMDLDNYIYNAKIEKELLTTTYFWISHLQAGNQFCI